MSHFSFSIEMILKDLFRTLQSDLSVMAQDKVISGLHTRKSFISLKDGKQLVCLCLLDTVVQR